MSVYIWDLDGTLIDSYSVMLDSIGEILKANEIDFDREKVYKHIKKTSVNDYFEEHAAELGETPEELKSRFSLRNRERINEIDLMPNAKETLKKLVERDDKNFIYTHKGESTYTLLYILGIADYFEEIITSENDFNRKPNPEALEFLIEKYDLDKDDTFYVGDRPIDIECAANAGIKSIFLYDGSVDSDADYVVDDLIEITSIQ